MPIVHVSKYLPMPLRAICNWITSVTEVSLHPLSFLWYKCNLRRVGWSRSRPVLTGAVVLHFQTMTSYGSWGCAGILSVIPGTRCKKHTRITETKTNSARFSRRPFSYHLHLRRKKVLDTKAIIHQTVGIHDRKQCKNPNESEIAQKWPI